jgi:hypothetical protein
MLTPIHQTPTDLRSRAKQHMTNWRQWWRVSPLEARDELDKAKDLLALAAEAEQFHGVGA